MSDEKSAHGTFCWNELMTRDVDAAKKFYSNSDRFTYRGHLVDTNLIEYNIHLGV